MRLEVVTTKNLRIHKENFP